MEIKFQSYDPMLWTALARLMFKLVMKGELFIASSNRNVLKDYLFIHFK